LKHTRGNVHIALKKRKSLIYYYNQYNIRALFRSQSTDGNKAENGKDASLTATNVGHGGRDGNGGERGNKVVGLNTPGKPLCNL